MDRGLRNLKREATAQELARAAFELTRSDLSPASMDPTSFLDVTFDSLRHGF